MRNWWEIGLCIDVVKSPDLVLDKADPGDDVSARFDYQHTYAAINAIRLITGEGDCVEIICESGGAKVGHGSGGIMLLRAE